MSEIQDTGNFEPIEVVNPEAEAVTSLETADFEPDTVVEAAAVAEPTRWQRVRGFIGEVMTASGEYYSRGGVKL